MYPIRKLMLAAFSAGIVATVSFLAGASLLAASPPAAQGKGAACDPGATHCSADITDAFAFWFAGDPTSSDQVLISATRSSFVVRPRGGSVTISPVETVVSIQVTNSSMDGFGCFVIPDNQFVVSSDLQLTRLNATLTTSELCFGEMTPVVSDGRAGPLAGGGGTPRRWAADSTDCQHHLEGTWRLLRQHHRVKPAMCRFYGELPPAGFLDSGQRHRNSELPRLHPGKHHHDAARHLYDGRRRQLQVA